MVDRFSLRFKSLRGSPHTALIVIVMLGVVLRFINIDARPLWYDEAFAMLYSDLSYDAMLEGTIAQSNGAAADVHPLFYYITLKNWSMVFGESAVAARSLSLVYGVGTILLVFGFMRELFDRRTATIAALFVAISPFQIAYSQEARMYAQLGFWSTATLWAFIRAARTNGLRAWVAFTIFGIATLYSHNLSFAFFAAIGMFVVVRFLMGLPKRIIRTSLLMGTISSALAMAAGFLPWLQMLPAQFSKITQSYWITPPTMVTYVQTMFAFGFWTDNQSAPLALVTAMLTGSLLIIALIAHELIHRRHEVNVRPGLLLMMTLWPIVVLAVVSYVVRPVYIIRGLIPAQTAFLMLAAWAAAKLPRVVQIGAGTLLGAILIFALLTHYAYDSFPRARWDDVASYLRSHALAGDAIVHDNKLTFFPMALVDPDLDQGYLRDVSGIGSDTLALPTQRVLGLLAIDVEEIMANEERIWLVIYSRARDDYRAAGFADDPNWLALESRFEVIEQMSFDPVEVFLFARSE